MQRKKEAVIVLEDPRLISRRYNLLNDEGVDVEVFVEVDDIILNRSSEIYPRDVFVLEAAHFFGV